MERPTPSEPTLRQVQTVWIGMLGTVIAVWIVNAVLVQDPRPGPAPTVLIVAILGHIAVMYVAAAMLFAHTLKTLQRAALPSAFSEMTPEQRSGLEGRCSRFLIITLALIETPAVLAFVLRILDDAYLPLLHGVLTVSLLGLVLLRVRGIPACRAAAERLTGAR